MQRRPGVDQRSLRILEHDAIVVVGVDLHEVFGVIALVARAKIAVAHVEAIFVLVFGGAVERVLVVFVATLDEATDFDLLQTIHARLQGAYRLLRPRQLCLDRGQALVERGRCRRRRHWRSHASWWGGFNWRRCLACPRRRDSGLLRGGCWGCKQQNCQQSFLNMPSRHRFQSPWAQASDPM